MPRDYCTLWDKNYITKGLCLIHSMQEHAGDYRLHVLALDGDAFEAAMGYAPVPNVTVTLLSRVEDHRLRQARQNRSWQEFCWTCASWWLAWCVDYLNAPMVYLDADSCFFGSPEAVFTEIGGASVALVPHRLEAKDLPRLGANGHYNVNWVFARNDGDGIAFAREWQNQCLEWCYYRAEDGKFGDQGYLDGLAEKYRAHSIQNLGLNLAPFNQRQYCYEWDGKLFVEGDPLILYHFHEFVDRGNLTGWDLHPMVRQYVYGPYLEVFEQLDAQRRS